MSVNEIEPFAFLNCKKLEQVNIENLRCKIHPYSFIGCDNLINVNEALIGNPAFREIL